jgi:hypothetical protein
MVATTSGAFDVDGSQEGPRELARPDPGERRRLLRTWVQDRLAASTFAFALLKRMIRENRGTPFERPLQQIHEELRDERARLDELAGAIAAPPPLVKQTAAWLGEKVERFKPNGRLLRYSPLSRVLELEMLLSATYAREVSWRALDAIPDDDKPEISFTGAERVPITKRHRDVLEALLAEAVAVAF